MAHKESPPSPVSPASTAPASSAPSDSPFIHFAYLHSWPLIGQFGSAEAFPIKRLDFEAERSALFSTLTNCRKAVRLQSEVATSDNLRQLVTLGCRAIHYTGHGLPSCLAFEDGEGKMHAMDSATLRSLVAAGGGAQGVKFVFVSACHSEIAGKSFVDAGVPHVIAVRLADQVGDRAAQHFMKHFYLALLVGRTVRDSFEIAKAAVQATPNAARGAEVRKFLLLPESGAHDEVIFGDLPPGQWIDFTPPPRPGNVPAIPEHFLGRNFAMQRIVATFQRKRLCTITGCCGVGKTALAKAAAHYIWKRNIFDGVYFISLKALKSQFAASIATLCSQAFQLDPVVNKNHDFLHSLRSSKFLLVFDEADACLDELSGGQRCIATFVNDLLRMAPLCKVLLTAIERVGGFTEFTETELPLTNLSPPDAAQLFWDLKPREISLQEFGCSDPNRAASQLAQHPALRALAGHPRRIFNAAPLLSGEGTLSDLVTLIEVQIKREEAGDCQGACKYRKHLKTQQETQAPAHAEGEPHAHARHASSAAISSSAPVLPLPENDREGFSPSSVSPPLQDFQLHRLLPEDREAQAFWQAFGAVSEVRWSEFAPALQQRFIQSCGSSERPLSAEDFQSIQAKIFSLEHRSGVISINSFAQFWNWWKITENLIKKLSPFWARQAPVLIHGFISRDAVSQRLTAQQAGTFLLRLSENNPGSIAVGFVDGSLKIQHILIDCSLRSGFKITLKDGERVYETLEELLMKCRLFVNLYPNHEKSVIFSPDQDQPH